MLKELFLLLKKPKNLLVLGLGALVFFSLNYYLAFNLPGSDGVACIEGANLNPFNIIFFVLTSIAFGLLLSGMIELYARRRTQKTLDGGSPNTNASATTKSTRKGPHTLVAGVAGVFGGIISFFTVFCVVCTLPFISIFGAAISLSFFTQFEVEFKLMSLTLMFLGLYLLNKQLEGCEVCEK